MEQSILKSTKKTLGVPDDYDVFDEAIMVHINTAFGTLNQIGVGPTDSNEGFAIDSEDGVWGDLGLNTPMLSMVKTYVFLRVKYLFDPPTTSFLLDAMKTQIDDHEVRLSYAREEKIPIPETPPVNPDEEVVFIPMSTYMEGGY